MIKPEKVRNPEFHKFFKYELLRENHINIFKMQICEIILSCWQSVSSLIFSFLSHDWQL